MMAGSFRRAHLRGSDELFRPTHPDAPSEPPGHVSRPAPTAPPPPAQAAAAPRASDRPHVQRHDGRLVRLTDEEIDILLEAVQHLRYPTSSKPLTKPPVDVFERLGELRHKLQDA